MAIYYRKELDYSDPTVCAACYQEWITNCWQEAPFTTFLPNGQLSFTFTRRNLPSLSGLYAVSGHLYSHHLELAIVRRRDKLFKISDCLPAWTTPERFVSGAEQMLYIGESENLFDRWSGHDKMVEFQLFLSHGIEMKFRFHAEPPLLQDTDSYRFATEKQLVKYLCPLLNFH